MITDSSLCTAAPATEAIIKSTVAGATTTVSGNRSPLRHRTKVPGCPAVARKSASPAPKNSCNSFTALLLSYSLS